MIPILIIVAALAVVILLVPHILLFVINKKLKTLPGYSGHIARLRLNFFNFVLHFDRIRLDKEGQSLPFFSAASARIKLSFRKLLKKELYGVLQVQQASLGIVKEHNQASPEKDASPSFNLKETLEKLLPFEMDFIFTNSSLTFVDDSLKESQPIIATAINIEILHFGNRATPATLTSDIKISAKVCDGTFDLKMALEPLAVRTTFDMNTEIHNINLVLLNSFLRQHISLDVNRGTFSMATEVACSQGKFKGYLKPMITDLDVVGPQDKGDGIFRRLWEAAVAFTYQILKNKSHDELASKIKIEGELHNPHVNVLSAVLSILKNGFIQSLTPSLDDVISLDSVKASVEKSKQWVNRIIS